MNFKKPLLLCSCALLLAGCQADTTISGSSEKLMTIGNVSITKGDEYNVFKEVSGTNATLALANKMIAEKEIEVTEDMKKEAKETLDSYMEIEGYEDQLKEAGYENGEAYMNDVLIPNLQSKKLVEKYFTDAKEDIIREYDPVLAVVIEISSEDNANKALEALKKGEDAGKVAGRYAAEEAQYTGTEQVITTQDTALPESLRNAILDAGKDGVLDQVFTNDTSTDDKIYYVASVISTDYDKNLDKIVSALSSNQTLSKDCQIYYLKKYEFEVHDQDIFDAFKANNPEFLVTRPDLVEDKTSE